MTLREICEKSRSRLSPLYGDGEARWLVRAAMEYIKGYTLADLALKANDEVTPWLAGKMDDVTSRLLHHEPIQYIFGYTRFYGLKLRVSPATLIPRPETEELVGLIVDEFGSRQDLEVLDACTGSGCIAVALARNLPFSAVRAFDISRAALQVAKENNETLHTRVDFFQADALNLTGDRHRSYDIIVSNPPYVADSERKQMDANVLDYEPHLALFVPDADPLVFYRAIAAFAKESLKPDGKLYFEINPLFAERLKADMVNEGWGSADLVKDTHGRNRFLIASLPPR